MQAAWSSARTAASGAPAGASSGIASSGQTAAQRPHSSRPGQSSVANGASGSSARSVNPLRQEQPRPELRREQHLVEPDRAQAREDRGLAQQHRALPAGRRVADRLAAQVRDDRRQDGGDRFALLEPVGELARRLFEMARRAAVANWRSASSGEAATPPGSGGPSR
jgi:hypothetical protein